MPGRAPEYPRHLLVPCGLPDRGVRLSGPLEAIFNILAADRSANSVPAYLLGG